MIARIIELSIRNRALVLMLTAMLMIGGAWGIPGLKIDAIPDLSDVQVIVTTEYPGQNPQVVDDQVTYPLSSALMAVPGATVVRGLSMFEQSFIYILFEDGTDLYWARARVLEYLNFASDRLPAGVQPKLGPDATGIGWVYQYVLYPGYYSPSHPQGLWYEPESGLWYPSEHDAPADIRSKLQHIRAWQSPGLCPVTGAELLPANQDLAQLRSLQDWYLRYPLTGVPGVSEVAAIGGFVRQYQVLLDPVKLRAFNLSIPAVRSAIERSNNDVGGSVIELAENEYMVRSRAYIRGVDDLATIPVAVGERGTPILLSDIATLQIGGEARRGVGELDGEGEAVGGIIVARSGENANQVIADVKARLRTLEPGLPPGVFIKPTYDRSALIGRAITTLRSTLIEEIIVVGLVCILFLLHARSELVAVFVLPASMISSLLAMRLLGINANIMSLGGLAISIGVVVDSAIVMVENGHKHLDLEEARIKQGLPPRSRAAVISEAAAEVGPQLFFSLLIITASFLPVFVLTGEAGRLFKPLAFTKTFAMAAAAFLSITIIPVLMVAFITSRVLPKQWGFARNLAITLGLMVLPAVALYLLSMQTEHLAPHRWWIAVGWALFAGMLLVPQRIVHEDHSPLSIILQWLYEPAFRLAMRFKWFVLFLTALLLASTWYPMTRIGSEFMPALDEGDLLYMPTTDPSVSITKSREILQQTDKLIKSIPEVLTVHGKIGRADTATDPAPLSMLETVIQLEPDRDKWRRREVKREFSHWPDWLKWPLTATFWPESRPLTMSEIKYGWQDPDGKMHPGLDSLVRLPGMRNSWLYPIETRISMLATGIRTPVGVKVFGPDPAILGDLADRIAASLQKLPATDSAYAERLLGGYYLDIQIDRAAAARHGLTTGDIQEVIQSAVGGMTVTTTVEGAERYPLNLRYAREFRDDIPALRQVLVTTPAGAQIPLGELADLRIVPGPPMIRSENAQRTASIVVVNRAAGEKGSVDIGGYIQQARAAIARDITFPPGYSYIFSGQYEFWQKTLPRLIAAGSVTMLIIVILLYVASRSWLRVGIILLAVPFSLIGAFWFLWALDYNLSLAVIIGFIALAGLDAENGMVMLFYLDSSYDRFKAEGRMNSRADLWAAVHDGAVKRIRPKTMTVASNFVGLVPLLWATGAGADVMRRLAAPMIGGVAISFLIELLVYPIIFYLAKSLSLPRNPPRINTD